MPYIEWQLTFVKNDIYEKHYFKNICFFQLKNTAQETYLAKCAAHEVHNFA